MFFGVLHLTISQFFNILQVYFQKKLYLGAVLFYKKEIYDSTITTLEYNEGVSGHIFVSWLHPFKEHRLVVVGSEAMISFEDSSEGKPLTLYSKN